MLTEPVGHKEACILQNQSLTDRSTLQRKCYEIKFIFKTSEIRPEQSTLRGVCKFPRVFTTVWPDRKVSWGAVALQTVWRSPA